MLIAFLTKAYKRYPFLSNMTLMFFVLTNLGFNIPIIGRVNMYFVFFYTLFIARTISNYKSNNSTTTILALSLMAIIIVLTVYAVVSPANKLYPYSFYWDNSNYFNYL